MVVVTEISIILLVILGIVMTVCLSIVQTEVNNMQIKPDFVGSRYYYILLVSFGVMFISFFPSVFSKNKDYLFYLNIILILSGIAGDLYITFGTKDVSSKQYI